MRMAVVVFAIVAGCGGAAGPVHGPYGGSARRFYVTSIMLPQQRSDYAVDLDADGRPDNGLGGIEGSIAAERAENDHADEIIAADAVPTIVELVSDDAALREDDSVGVRWIGAGDGDQLGARLHGGNLTSNPVTATMPAHATVRLPLFADADESTLALDHYQLDLAPDGAGGFVGQLNGTIVAADAVAEMGPQLIQMIRNDRRPLFISWFDKNRDGQVTLDEIASDAIVRSLAASDVRGGGLSVGFLFTMAPCSDDACTRAKPAASCFDRVRNGDETDVDCGGGCGPCAGGAACVAARDCQTGACDGGVCRAPSCSDGIRDGEEIDVDCGPGCAPCVDGMHCHDNADCQSGVCGADAMGNGVCVPKS